MTGPFEFESGSETREDTSQPARGPVCAVCGSGALRSDAVARPDGESWLMLGECAHCAHRWTRPLPGAPARTPLRVAAGRVPEDVRAA